MATIASLIWLIVIGLTFFPLNKKCFAKDLACSIPKNSNYYEFRELDSKPQPLKYHGLFCKFAALPLSHSVTMNYNIWGYIND